MGEPKMLIYDNYCGPGNNAPLPPIDALDAACARHDACTPDGKMPSSACNARLEREAEAISHDPRQPSDLQAMAGIRVADGHKHRMRDDRMQCMPGDEVWLVGERRPSGEQKYYLSNLPPETPLRKLAATIKARWVCEQAHQQLKEELGLDHFEGRSWTGLYRHALMTMIAFAFLQARRLKAAGRKKKNRGAATSAEHAGHSTGHPRSLCAIAATAMPPL